MILVILLLFVPLSLAQSGDAEFISLLSDTEREWLQEHSSIVYIGDPNWLPYEAIDNSGNYTGMITDYLEIIQDITGLKLNKIKAKSWPESMALALNDSRIDMVTAVREHEFLSNKYTDLTPIISNNISVIMRDSHAVINDLGDLQSKKISAIKDFGYVDDLRKEYPDIIFGQVEDIQDGLEKVSNGNIDALVVSKAIGSYSMPLFGYTDLKFVGPTKVSIDLTLHVSNAEPVLQGIIDKAINFVKPYELRELAVRWLGSGDLTGIKPLQLKLTQQERDYLRKISPIKYTGDPDWLPYEAFDEKGQYVGLVADHLHMLEELLDIKFEIIPTTSWGESVELARNGKIDVLSETEISVLKGEMLFSRTYSSSPTIIVMRETQNFVESLNNIRDKKIALIKDYGYDIELRKQYPYLSFFEFENLQDGLNAVATSQVDALICNSAQAIFYIDRLGLTNVKIVGRTKFDTELALAVNPEKKDLVPILNKALDVIYLSPQQQDIFDKWSDAEHIEEVDYSFFYKIFAVALLLVLLVLWGNYRLSKDIERRKKVELALSQAKEAANEANAAKSRFLAVMSHELRTPLNGILGMLELHQKTDLSIPQRNTVRIIKESSESLLNILNDILDFSKIEADKMVVALEAINLKTLIETCVNAQVQNAYNKGLSVAMYIDPKLNDLLWIDAVRIRQIINNFVSNAIKFTAQGGVTIIANVLQESDEETEFSISVKDTGIGISEENQKLLFQEFMQIDMSTNRKFGGTGLGLSICRRLARLMGGSIRLQSDEGLGTEISYSQLASYTEQRLPKHTKWAGFTFVILTEDEFAKKALESYIEYLGATLFSIDTIPADSRAVAELLEKNDIDVIIADDDFLKHRYDAYVQDQIDGGGMHLIRLVKEMDLSANNVINNIGLLNTNPLQPRYLELLGDLCLGMEVAFDEQEEQRQDKIVTSQIKLLVVEDHPTNRELLSRQLQHLGYTFKIVNDGMEALEIWREESFDGILTDCHMPRMNGYDLAQHIRDMGYIKQPIIAISANAMSGEKAKCVACGMNDLLVKPVNISTLSKTLEKYFVKNTSYSIAAEGQENSGAETELVGIHEKLLKLEEICFGRKNISVMLDSYVEATNSDIHSLNQAMRGHDLEQSKLIAHKMNGAARLMLADGIESLTNKIKVLNENLTQHEVSDLIAKFKSVLSNYHNALKQEL